MESSTPVSSSADDSNAQDPLALPNTNDSIGLYHDDLNRDQNEICRNDAALSISCIDKESNLSENPTSSGIYPSAKHEEHHLSHEQRLQYEANHQMSSNYVNSAQQQKMNQLSMQHQQQQQQILHEPHKTFSHSIENLSKTTEKCSHNELKM